MSHTHKHVNVARMCGLGDFCPPEPVESGLQPCPDCDGEGCVCCNFAGYFFGDQPMTAREYERFVQRMREDFAS